MAKSKPKKPQHDWETIEKEYRAGVFSIRAIGRKNGISDTAIRKKAAEFKWERDLTQRIRDRVRIKLVRKKLRELPTKAQTERTEDEAVEETAEFLAGLTEKQQIAVDDTLSLIKKVIKELEDTKNLTKDGRNRRNSDLVPWLNSISNNLARMIPLQRQLLGLEDPTPDKDKIDKIQVEFIDSDDSSGSVS